MNAMKKIITVDDNLTNLTVLKNILKPVYETYPVSSAAKMFDLLEKVTPDLILLDVEMPDISGYDAIRLLKSNPAHRDIPVIFVSALSGEKEELTGLELGAVDYIYKPFVASVLLRHIETHLKLAEAKRELLELNGDIQRKLSTKIMEVFELQNSILDIVASMVESRDGTTGGHIYRIQKYLMCLIESMVEQDIYTDEVTGWDLDFLIPSSQLHDVGKIAISDIILNKPGKLTPEEYEVMKTHVPLGADAISRMQGNVKGSSFLNYALVFAEAHHERWDGLGYPYGLSGENIPLIGRIMAIADVYDALVSTRPYKEPLSPEKAAMIILDGDGTQFDPNIIKVFKSVSDKFAEIAALYQEF
ncbi:MAG: response regulator [Oscillospiraceae bacterium]|nr:response regulator [Oscillospiraceae bacterium]